MTGNSTSGVFQPWTSDILDTVSVETELLLETCFVSLQLLSPLWTVSCSDIATEKVIMGLMIVHDQRKVMSVSRGRASLEGRRRGVLRNARRTLSLWYWVKS